jgi:hypothetical protein
MAPGLWNWAPFANTKMSPLITLAAMPVMTLPASPVAVPAISWRGRALPVAPGPNTSTRVPDGPDTAASMQCLMEE